MLEDGMLLTLEWNVKKNIHGYGIGQILHVGYDIGK